MSGGHGGGHHEHGGGHESHGGGGDGILEAAGDMINLPRIAEKSEAVKATVDLAVGFVDQIETIISRMVKPAGKEDAGGHSGGDHHGSAH